MKTYKVLALTKYGRLGASSRMRFLQYLPWLQRAGIEVTVRPLLLDELLEARYQSGAYGWRSLVRTYAERYRLLRQRSDFDVVWIEKEALPWVPLAIERVLLRGVPYILDYDDAVFHQYDQHPHAWVRRFYGRRLDGLMAGAALVVGGNNYLAQRARDAGSRWVKVVPTVIDLDRYHIKTNAPVVGEVPRIVWIGSPSTARYLNLLLGPLRIIAEKQPFILRVIGGGMIDMTGLQVEAVAWSEETEVENIRSCDLGVMPLVNSSWEQGKCGYKLIQYMACGLPVVASNVGVNADIVQDGKNGFLVNTSDEWVTALGKLLADSLLRSRLGLSGRQLVEQSYCIQQTGSKVATLIQAVADKSKVCI